MSMYQPLLWSLNIFTIPCAESRLVKENNVVLGQPFRCRPKYRIAFLEIQQQIEIGWPSGNRFISFYHIQNAVEGFGKADADEARLNVFNGFCFYRHNDPISFQRIQFHLTSEYDDNKCKFRACWGAILLCLFHTVNTKKFRNHLAFLRFQVFHLKP